MILPFRRGIVFPRSFAKIKSSREYLNFRTAFDKYLLDIIGLDRDSDEENQLCSEKKLLSFLK